MGFRIRGQIPVLNMESAEASIKLRVRAAALLSFRDYTFCPSNIIRFYHVLIYGFSSF